ncbi:MAG: hypothetical protein ACFCU7_09010 [Pleurocapsa sp.]
MASSTERIVAAFRACTLPRVEWTHQAHLQVGLWHLLHYSPSEALSRLRQGIKQYNISCGIENNKSQGYHETITQFYVCLINQFIRQTDCSQPIDLIAHKLINCCGNPSLLFKYYSRERLMSQTARKEWIEPDLMPLTKNHID